MSERCQPLRCNAAQEVARTAVAADIEARAINAALDAVEAARRRAMSDHITPSSMPMWHDVAVETMSEAKWALMTVPQRLTFCADRLHEVVCSETAVPLDLLRAGNAYSVAIHRQLYGDHDYMDERGRDPDYCAEWVAARQKWYAAIAAMYAYPTLGGER